MDNDKMKEAIESLVNSFTSKSDAEANELVKDALENIKESGYKIDDPEDFDCLVMHKANNCLKAITKTLHEAPADNVKDKSKSDFIFINYAFLEHNIRELCTLREGSTCCADKSRYILRMYLNYAIHGTIPEFNPEEEHYWTPNFGDNKMWIDLCDGLYRFYYGYTKEYFEAYNALVQCEIRKFKHILHRWFIEYVNGEKFEFTTTWDDRTDNPLKFDEDGDYYVVLDKYVGTIEHEPYKTDNEKLRFFYKRCVKVHKDNIKRIYHEDEERMC